MSDQTWTVSSGIGAKTGIPFVSIVTPTGALHQCSADEATDLALNLIHGAEASRFDLAFFRSMRERFGMEPQEIGLMLRALRDWRDAPPGGPLLPPDEEITP